MQQDGQDTQNNIDEEEKLIILCSGRRASGGAFWAYLDLDPQKTEAYFNTTAESYIQLSNYGKIICWGLGNTPSDEVRKYMEEEYSVDHTLHERLREQISSLEQNIIDNSEQPLFLLR